MNIFGVGGTEFALILIIALVVAGPKRMIHWMYILGKYTARLRRMWDETITMLQKEFDDAGVDIQLPKEVPTRQSLNRTIAGAMKPISAPLEEAMQEVEQTNRALGATARNGRAAAAPKTPTNPAAPTTPPAPPAAPPSEFGTWGGTTASSDEDSTP
jgi:Sec-independent protein translocase protein TatA